MEGRSTGTVGKRRNNNNQNTKSVPFVPACEIIAAVREGRNIESLFHHVPQDTAALTNRDRNNNPPGANLATNIFNSNDTAIQSDFNENSIRTTNLLAKKSVNARLHTIRLEEKEEPRSERSNNKNNNSSTNVSNITLLANKSITNDKNGNKVEKPIDSQSALSCDNVPAIADDGKASSIIVDIDDTESNSSKSIDSRKSTSSRKPSDRAEKSSKKSSKSSTEGKKKRIKVAQADISKSSDNYDVYAIGLEDRDDDQDAETLELAKLRCTSERTEVIAEREIRRQKRCADYPGGDKINL